MTATYRVLSVEAQGTVERDLGAVVHRAGAGWAVFEIDTRGLSGEVGDLMVDVAGGAGPESSPYCFDADTR